MATITVTTLTDENDPGAMPGLPGGAGLSLREAITFANSNSGGDVIQFEPFLSGGTITLTNGQLTINGALTIDGDIDDDKSPDITVNANNASRVINTSADLTLRGLTITGGRTSAGGGAGILSGAANLTIEDSRITGNAIPNDFGQGGGIFIIAGNLTITNSSIDNNSTNGKFGRGAGIYSDNADVTLIGSTINGNITNGPYGNGGGGIATDDGNITLINSTVSGNSTAGSGAKGGGIYGDTGSITLTSSTVSGNSTTGLLSNGGGIASNSGPVTLTNSTVAGNSAAGGNASGGGIYSSSANIYLTNTTMTGNNAAFLGGAIEFISGTVLVTNSLVLGNSASGNPEISGSWSDAGFNIVGGTPADIFAAIDGVSGGGLLADNGGPVQTVALKDDPSNPALDAGDDSLDPATDARGRGRFDFAGVANNGANISDLGAFELVLPEARSLIVTTLDDVVDQLDGETSLREAIAFANDPTAGTFSDGDADGIFGAVDTITFAPALATGGTITLGGTQLSITAPLIINNGTVPDIVIDADGLSRVIRTSAVTTLLGLTITGGHALGAGGGILVDGPSNLNIEYSAIIGNSTAGVGAVGGGIHSGLGGIQLTYSTVSNNSTTGYGAKGGGISGFSGGITITGSTVAGNSTSDDLSMGGGIYSDTSPVSVFRSTISGNRTTGTNSAGGGIYSRGGALTITNSTIIGNSTAETGAQGGGVAVPANVTVLNSTVTGNSTAGSDSVGGGIFAGTMSLTNSIVSGNVTSNSALGYDNLRVTGGGVVPTASIVGGDNALIFDQVTEVVDGLGVATGVFAGVLADNGGRVQTVALKDDPTNPALDAGDDTLAPGIDARGVARLDYPDVANNLENMSDLGAFELGLVAEARSLTVTTLDDVVDEFDGKTSLREAIAFANDPTAGGGTGDADGDTLANDTITFDPTLAGGTITLAGGLLVATDVITIDGDIDNDHAPDITIDANHLSTILIANSDTSLLGLIMINGSTSGPGGAIASSGNLTIEDSAFFGNSTNADYAGGGAIYGSQKVTITNSVISGNSTKGPNSRGGGVYSDEELVITGSIISGNTTSGNGSHGGGVFTRFGASGPFGTIRLTDSIVSGNSTTGDSSSGGGIFGTGNVYLTNSTVSDNSTGGNFSDGGGISSDSSITLTNSTVSGNSTSGSSSEGGGIYSNGTGGVTLVNSTVSGNTTSGQASEGGGIYGTSGPIDLTNSIVLGNATTFAGVGGDEIDGLALVNEAGNNIIGGTSGAPAPADVFAAIDGTTGGGLLADNGGPVQTIALKASTSNPALDAGDDTLAPATDARGEARFDFAAVANNATNISDLGAFELQFVPNVPPSGANKTVTTNEDAAYTFVLADFGYSDAGDPAPDAFAAVRIATLPASGSLQLGGVPVTAGQIVPVASITGGSLKFVPAPNANGVAYASFTFQVRDDGGTASGGQDTDQSPNTITVNVSPVPDPPTAPATNSVTTPEDTPSGPVTIGATDPDGDIASYALKPGSGPSSGSVSFSGDTFVYTPGGNYNGPDSFVIRITDSQGNTVEQVVSVTVTGVPDAPVAIDDATSAVSGQTKLIPASDLLANDFDLDGDAISLTGVSNPVGGTVSLSGTTVSFTPTPGFTGVAGFDYTIAAVDGSSTARVTVTVSGGAPLNNAPVIAPIQPVKSLENTVQVLVLASDADGDPLTYSATNGANGIVTGGANGLFVYSAASGFVGTDSFTVTVSDGRGGSASRTVAVTVIDLPDGQEWIVRAPDRHISEIGGTGLYVGTTGFQKIGVLDVSGLVTFNDSIASVRLAQLFIPSGTQTYGPVPGGTGSEVIGSNAAERISLAADANVVLDASFVRGNDTVVILGPFASYAVSSSVAGIAITSAAGAHIRIPAFGIGGGVTLQFSDLSLPLATVDGATFTLGGQTITDSPLMIGSGLPPSGESTGTLVYRGGDLVLLPGDAGDWCIIETAGGAALLSDGDTHVLIPLGAAGVLLSFDDGLRTLARDPHTGFARIGNQALGEELVAVDAERQSIALPGGGDPAVEARLQLNAGGEVAAGGRFHVEGTAGAEQVSLQWGTFEFDQTFAQGGDSLRFPDAANTFTAARQGNAAILQGAELTAKIPAGQTGATLYFEQDARLLVFDSGDMLIGTQIITGTASPLTFA